MKTKTIYQCEYCLKEYKTSKEARKCEADCLGITVEEYLEYLELLYEEKKWFNVAASVLNDEVRKKCDEAIKAVIEFQEKHGLEGMF